MPLVRVFEVFVTSLHRLFACSHPARVALCAAAFAAPALPASMLASNILVDQPVAGVFIVAATAFFAASVGLKAPILSSRYLRLPKGFASELSREPLHRTRPTKDGR